MTEKTKTESKAFDYKELTLGERILWVRDNVTRIGKDAIVSTGGSGGYKAVTHDKVTGLIRPLMTKAGILSTVTCTHHEDKDTGLVSKAGRKIFQHQCMYEVRFYRAENFPTDEPLVMNVPAYADDFGDKGPGKALSYAIKYALLKTFMVETGEDDEERADTNENARQATLGDDLNAANDLWAKADELFGEDAADVLTSLAKRRFKINDGDWNKIPQARIRDAYRSLEQKARGEV